MARLVFPRQPGTEPTRVRVPIRLGTQPLPIHRTMFPAIFFSEPIVQMTARGLRFHTGDPREQWQELPLTEGRSGFRALVAHLEKARTRKKDPPTALRLAVAGTTVVPKVYPLLAALGRLRKMAIDLQPPL